MAPMEQISLTGTIPHIGIASVVDRETGDQEQQIVAIFEVPAGDIDPKTKPEDRPDPVKMYQFPMPDEAARAMARAILSVVDQKSDENKSGIWVPPADTPSKVARKAAGLPTENELNEHQAAKLDGVKMPGRV